MTVTVAVPDSVPSSEMSARPLRRERGFMPNELIVLLHGFYHGAWDYTRVIADRVERSTCCGVRSMWTLPQPHRALR
jgi:hypothetical protein